MVFLSGGQNCSSRDLLTASLRCYLGQAPLPRLDHTERGKPFFSNCPTLHVSLSHSEDLVLCALGQEPVGVDIEYIRPRRETLPRYALTSLEFGSWEAQGKTWPAFYELWTRKEAWCKLTGEGLALTIRQEVPNSGFIWAYYQGENWRASLCGQEELPTEIHWLDIPQKEDSNGKTDTGIL